MGYDSEEGWSYGYYKLNERTGTIDYVAYSTPERGYQDAEPRAELIANRPAQPSSKTEAAQRKEYPLATGVLDYFPDALMEIAHVSYLGNQQHHPDKPLHWDRAKSTDEADAMLRHFKDRGTRDSDGGRHTAKAAWRLLALLQKEIEAEQQEGP